MRGSTGNAPEMHAKTPAPLGREPWHGSSQTLKGELQDLKDELLRGVLDVGTRIQQDCRAEFQSLSRGLRGDLLREFEQLRPDPLDAVAQKHVQLPRARSESMKDARTFPPTIRRSFWSNAEPEGCRKPDSVGHVEFLCEEKELDNSALQDAPNSRPPSMGPPAFAWSQPQLQLNTPEEPLIADPFSVSRSVSQSVQLQAIARAGSRSGDAAAGEPLREQGKQERWTELQPFTPAKEHSMDEVELEETDHLEAHVGPPPGPSGTAAAEWKRKASLNLNLQLARARTATYIAEPKKRCWEMTASDVLQSNSFDNCVGLLIFLNACTIGVQTDIMASKRTEEVPVVFVAFDQVFLVLFSAELLLRVYVHRCSFFNPWSAGAAWNWFDLFIVAAQIVEESIRVIALSNNIKDEGSEASDFKVMRMLRILRLMRVLRVMRVLRLISELRTIVSSILGSMKSLAEDASEHILGRYFGSISRSILTLYQAVSGGIDWDSIMHPLIEELNPLNGIAFTGYVAFTLLALMNVVTGVFVQTALQNAKEEEDLFLTDQIMKLFEISNREQRKTITLEEINARLCNPEAAGEWKSINVQAEEAKYLFELLDIDETGEIGFEEFLSGCLRLHGCAKSFDLLTVMQEARSMMRTWHIQYQQFQGSLDAIMRQVVMSASANAVLKSSLDHLMDLTSGHQDGLSHLERRLQSLERSVSTVRRALWSMDNLQSLLDALASPNGEGAAPGDHEPGDVLV
mmetsp:Transcript_114455/g.357931  ORF Transcript_114455/g.357931 Transcript_114455/m.357931 type:complete len:742 (-) Transcript_114455:50-2275(-)